MFEKFTERGRKIMSLARQEAQRLNAEFIGTEHMLLGVIQEGGGVAGKVLKNLKIDSRKVVEQIEKLVTPSTKPTVTLGQLPFSPRAKRVIELAGEESSRLKIEWIGTGQIMIGLIRESEGIAFQVMTNLGLNLHELRTTVETYEMQNQLPTEEPGMVQYGKMRLRLYTKVSSALKDGHVLIVNGDTYLEGPTITLIGINPEKRAEVAAAVAKEHGASVYAVENQGRIQGEPG